MKNNRHRRRLTWTSCTAYAITSGLVLGDGLLASAHAAGLSPYLFIGVTHDDNVFRLADNADTQALLGTDERGDVYRVFEAGVDLQGQAARQVFNLHGAVDQTRFARFTALNSDGGSARGRWDWVVGNRWNGKLGYDYDRSLANLETQIADERNLRGDQRGYVEANYLMLSRWRVQGDAERREVDNSLEERRVLDTAAVSTALALHYLSVPAGTATDEPMSEPNYFGLQQRFIHGDYEQSQDVAGVAVDNDYDESETAWVADWRFPAGSHAQLRLGHTHRRYLDVTQRDFSGGTGRATFDWPLSGKTTLAMAAWRELTQADDQSASYVVSQGTNLGPSWAMTYKLKLSATLINERRDYRGDPTPILTSAPKRVDRLDSVRVTLGYALVDYVHLDLAWKTGTRDSNTDNGDYRYHSVSATLRASF
ncbi:MAG: outer membrane beta-barrel protein [Gammaproteobacteria bacterium]|nr:outer membrane beta-barrel protein [Gammaproteobacteria bacterium]